MTTINYAPTFVLPNIDLDIKYKFIFRIFIIIEILAISLLFYYCFMDEIIFYFSNISLSDAEKTRLDNINANLDNLYSAAMSCNSSNVLQINNSNALDINNNIINCTPAIKSLYNL